MNKRMKSVYFDKDMKTIKKHQKEINTGNKNYSMRNDIFTRFTQEETERAKKKCLLFTCQ